MTDWREQILKAFTLGAGKVTLVADPDRLFTDPSLSEVLTTKGFSLLLFEDPVAFRFAYESKYRLRSDLGQLIDLVVLYQGDSSSAQALPFDLLVRSRQLSFALSDLFPNFSYPVLAALGPHYLDLLFEAQARFSPGVLGENATKDFILHHVFEIAAELIKSDADLLRSLLRRHYQLQVIPPLFVSRLVQLLAETHRFDEWPLETLFQSRSDFLTFLQERWPAFLSRFLSGRHIVQPNLVVPGPPDLPFENADVRVYIDNLFVERLLQPVDWRGSEDLSPSWYAFGIRRDPGRDNAERLGGLLQILERDLPTPESRHDQWLSFARAWAELAVVTVQVGKSIKPEEKAAIDQIRDRADTTFRAWLERRFGPLHNLPSSPPVLVHHIARHLVSQKMQGIPRISLIVVDGLSFDQWLVLRDQISKHGSNKWRFEEGAVFAWIPTITSISRQTIFAGKAPLYFPSSVYTTAREASLWRHFWVEHGLDASEVGYLKGLGEQNSLESVEELSSSSRMKVLGLVVDKVDRIMHGMELGAAGMHNQVRQWANEGFIDSLLNMLLAEGFAVYITSDHGNIEAAGCGRPKEGVLAEIQGERARIYSEDMLRNRVASTFPDALCWKPLGLPEDFLPLLAPGRRAFVLDGQRTVSHGGIALEEVVVPFVRVVERKQ